MGIDTYDDPVGQILSSHHWRRQSAQPIHPRPAPPRAAANIWPSELELMGQLAGLALAQRWAGWQKEPFTADSTEQVVVFEKPG